MPDSHKSSDELESALFEIELESAPEPEEDSGAPLAARMRPRVLDEFVGQEQVVGEGTLLRRAIEEDRLRSVIFWGPPGSGKSTLAAIIARNTRAAFEPFSAVTSGVADVRKVIDRAQERRKKLNQRTILFIDEIHRWNRAQQDALLPHVENGTVILIGATTENPYFEVNAPLISRSRVFRFESLPDDAIEALVRRALADPKRGVGRIPVDIDPEAVAHIVGIAGGDARTALNILESAVESASSEAGSRRVGEHGSRGDAGTRGHGDTESRSPAQRATELKRVTLAIAEEAAQQRTLQYDKQSDEHYDTISAFIKSVRGSDPDAAIYWLAKMLLAGEDPKFIARRLVILASEDIGNADSMGLLVATAAADAVMFIGMPEAQLTLAQATTYLAAAPKSNASCIAISRAMEDIRSKGPAPVPLHLRNLAHPGLGQFGHGKGYLYPHDYPGGYVQQEYAAESARSAPYYEPKEIGAESEIKERLESLRSAAASAPGSISAPREQKDSGSGN